MSTKPTLSLSTPKTANFPRRHGSVSSSTELRSATSLPSALSEGRTPLSAVSRSSIFKEPLYSSGLPSAGLPTAGLPTADWPRSALARLEGFKTPVTPPVAYLDFLKGNSSASPGLATPPQTGQMPAPATLTRTRTSDSTSSMASNESCSTVDSSSSDNSDNSDCSDASLLDGQDDRSGDQIIDSAPSTGTTDTSYGCQEEKRPFVLQPVAHKKKVTSPKAVVVKEEPVSMLPTPNPVSTSASAPTSAALQSPMPPTPSSAPPSTAFPSSRIPPSPAFSGIGPRGAGGLYSPIRTPRTARARTASVFDWEAALARRLAEARRSGSSIDSRSPVTAGTKRPAGMATSPNPGRTDLAAAVAAAATAASRISPTLKAPPAIKSPSATAGPPTSPHTNPGLGPSSPLGGLTRTSVHEVVRVTRTFTYSGPPRVGPAPKGKRRKLDNETAVES